MPTRSDPYTVRDPPTVEWHRSQTPIDHPDGSVTMAKLARPLLPYGYTLAFLAASGYVDGFYRATSGYVLTNYTQFNDGSCFAYVQVNAYANVMGRVQTSTYMYYSETNPGATAADHKLCKIVGGAYTNIATESIDLSNIGIGLRISCSGSTIKSMRYDLLNGIPILYVDQFTPVATISATDTSISGGQYGVRFLPADTSQQGGCDGTSAIILAAASPGPSALAILEAEVTGSGGEDDPYSPLLSKNLVETDRIDAPLFLKRERRRWEILRSKGFTDEEMRVVFGYVPQHQVDLDAATWGAFEISEKHPTAVLAVYGDNPYKAGAIRRQAEHARRKGLRVFDPPKDYGEAVALYRELAGDYPHWIAGVHNWCYQVFGHELYDWLQNVDFYYGELLEHKTHYDQMKRVPDWIIWDRLLELKAKLEQASALREERDKHLRKVEELLKKGW